MRRAPSAVPIRWDCWYALKWRASGYLGILSLGVLFFTRRPVRSTRFPSWSGRVGSCVRMKRGSIVTYQSLAHPPMTTSIHRTCLCFSCGAPPRTSMPWDSWPESGIPRRQSDTKMRLLDTYASDFASTCKSDSIAPRTLAWTTGNCAGSTASGEPTPEYFANTAANALRCLATLPAPP